jgi:IS30 family transposase
MTSKRSYQQLSENECHAIARNGGGNGYASKYAQQRRDRRRRHARAQPKPHRDGPLLAVVRAYLRQHWLPQQIAKELRWLMCSTAVLPRRAR